jgi:hypothetical protein
MAPADPRGLLANAKTRREFRPKWTEICDNCGQTPVVPISGLCGPCHFGTADAVHGGWWDTGRDDFDLDFVEEHI